MQRRNFLQKMLVGGGLVGGGLVGAGTRPGHARELPASTPMPTVMGVSTGEPLQAARTREPIIDVHMHAYPADMDFPDPLPSPANGKPPGVKNGEEHRQACLAEMKRLNIVKGVVSGGDGDRIAAALNWRNADRDRFIAGAGIRGSAEIPLPEIGALRKAFTEGGLGVLGEVTAQYAGLSLSDRPYEEYLRLAEELDIPVSVHMGLGPPGSAYDSCCRGFRASLGNPLVLEEALARHPKLRLNMMHGGWPFLQETIALLNMYPGAYTDLGAINWLTPRPAFYRHLQSLVEAGFTKRLLFGSDQMYWPEAIGMAVETIEAAPFLTAADKRDIFYNNAVRFLKLDQASERKTG